ncbi:VWA domain-containing protein [Derxia gummosa]|uniref:VWA domain-containing protein n=1 Tax=Derxia gummosa DSM 723 TaxID=1121388 RepID=A0A8B6X6G8_9BURK|nr:VWA domain-containing protein [Derxia gummosa]
MNDAPPTDAALRWRLILGSEADACLGGRPLAGDDAAIDRALGALYEPPSDRGRRGGLGASAPGVARWLGDIRNYFPASVVRLMQQDAIERLDLRRLLLEPEMLDSVEPDVHLAATLVSLAGVIPERTKETARLVVRRIVDELERRLAQPLRQAIAGSLDRSTRTRRPRPAEIDWPRTIRANLRHWQPEYRTVIPAERIGHGRRRRALRRIVLCIDQSGSMAASVVYSSVFAAVMASLPAVDTRMVVFDTAVVDLTHKLADPVDVLFGIQLGGGTDIAQALRYCRDGIEDPTDTILVLISDLIEGGNRGPLLRVMHELVSAGVQVITLLALSDEGKPAYDHETAANFAALGSPAFACTPDLFPELMAAAIDRRDLGGWLGERGIVSG